MALGVLLVVLADWRGVSTGLDNGLALTPPMGWLTWQRFRCQTDCKTYPQDCVSEALVVRQAQMLAHDGWLARGYEYIIIDDCWSAHERDPTSHRLQPDPTRFPHVSVHSSPYPSLSLCLSVRPSVNSAFLPSTLLTYHVMHGSPPPHPTESWRTPSDVLPLHLANLQGKSKHATVCIGFSSPVCTFHASDEGGWHAHAKHSAKHKAWELRWWRRRVSEWVTVANG